MNKSTTQTEIPRRLTVRERIHEYIEIRRTTSISIVDVIAWFCAAASIISTLYYLYFGYR